ncbi:MAG: MBL fold metallo-hydrolase [Myxococcales bacterium]|nr:MBL fold metallo-hydrolase [Myxococcales bacterium]
MIFRQLFDADSWTYTYLLVDDATGEALIIDPVREQVSRDLTLISELGATLKFVLDTHVHADHITGAGALSERTGAVTVASEEGATCVQRPIAHGDELFIGQLQIKALGTPGHTADSLSYYLPGHVFTGDALLIRGTGRTDFQNGNSEQLYQSITKVLFDLPDETRVWPGHDYRGLTVSTIGEEKRFNPRVSGKSKEEFVSIMADLKLAAPKHIQVAVPANLACGRDTNGPVA